MKTKSKQWCVVLGKTFLLSMSEPDRFGSFENGDKPLRLDERSADRAVAWFNANRPGVAYESVKYSELAGAD